MRATLEKRWLNRNNGLAVLDGTESAITAVWPETGCVSPERECCITEERRELEQWISEAIPPELLMTFSKRLKTWQ